MKTVLFVCFLVSSVTCFGQYYNSTAQTNITFTTAPKTVLTGLQPPPRGVSGTAYFYDDPGVADIYLKDSTKIEQVSVRLDMSANVIEIQHNNEVKVLPVSRVLGLSLRRVNGIQEEFINSKVLFKSGIYTERLMKVVYSGQVALICKADVHLKEASRSQNPMLGTNRDDDELVVKKSYIISRGADVVDTDQNKSKVNNELTAKFGPQVTPLVKRTNLKKEDELIELVKQLNEMAKS